MARRVELDLIEQEMPVEIPLGEAASEGLGGEGEPLLEVRTSFFSRLRKVLQVILSRIKHSETLFSWETLRSRISQVSWKSFLSWKILVPACVAIALIVAGSFSYVLYRQREAAQMAAEKAKQVASSVPVVREAAFPDFSIDIKDARGQYRFLQCDITLEFQSGVELTENRKAEIRKVIYLAARKNGNELIRATDSGRRLKKEMREELRNLLGEGALKEIYFTRYVLI